MRGLRTALGMGLVGCFAFAAGWGPLAEEKPKADPIKDAMQLKLELSQNILEGIAVEDFDEVSENAEKLKTLAKVEGWLHRDTRAYKSQLQVFQFANDELARFAKEKDGDGAALAYVQLTLSCVNCHKYLRDAGD
jgi:cytochrome c556